MKKKLPKYQFAGQNPCGPGTVWDATQKMCVPTQQVDPVFDNALWGNPDAQNQGIINPNAITPPIMRTTGDRTSFNEQARQVNGKVIPSDVQAIFRGYNNEILPDINAGTKDKAGNWIPDKNVIGDAIDKGFNYDSDGVYRKKEISVDKNNLGYSAGFKALNVGLDVARLIGNNINDFKNSKEEEEKLLAARYKKAKYNSYETGLNNVPAYAQDGGEIDEDGGGKKRRKQGKNLPAQYNIYNGIIDRNGKEILHPTEFQAMQNMTDYLKHNWSDQATEPSNVYRAQFQHLAVNENQMMQPQQPIAKYGVDLMATGGDTSKNDKAIAAAALNGGSINGSKLTAKQKKHFKYVLEGKIPLDGHIKDAKKAGTYEIGGEADVKMLLDNEDLDQMQNGGIPDRYKNKGFTKVGAKRKSNHPGKKWMVLAKKGDKYKVVHGGDSNMQDFSQHHDKQRQKNFWNRMGHSSDPFSARYWHAKFNTWADGGTVDEVEQTNMQPNAELEQGEVFQQQSGDIQKVAENEPTHEEGGSMQADVHRVLEDTSDKRKDKMSKALRVTPAEAELIVGFKPKSTTSHSKLYELAHKKNEAELKRTEVLIGKNLDFIKYNNGGKYAQNSAEENLKILQTAKRKEDIFNDIFDHQENIKQQEAMLTEQKQMQYGGVPKYAVGGADEAYYDVDPYTGGVTKTPKGNNNAYNKDKNYLKRWEAVIPGVSKLNNKEAQAAIYSYTLKNNPDAIKQMWEADGNTAQGRRNHNFDQFTTNGVFNAGVLDDKNMLGDLSDAYVDGMFGRRQLEPPAPVAATPQKSYGFTGPVDDNNPAPVVRPAVVEPAKAALPTYTQPKPITPSELHSPLGLSGGLGNVLGYIGASGRTPVDLEQLDRTPLRVHEVNPLPTLLENQGAFNAAIEQLPNNGVGFANTANLAGQKYKVNNQVLGQYENTNKQKYDQVDQYNDQAQYQLDGTNLQLRDQFVNRVLTGEEKQRLQKQEYANSFFKAVDERNAFDANGNLALKLSPYFNAKGEFNGNDYNINAKYMAETGNTFKYDTDTKGNVYKTMYDKNGKIIPNSRIITDKSASKNTA